LPRPELLDSAAYARSGWMRASHFVAFNPRCAWRARRSALSRSWFPWKIGPDTLLARPAAPL
jgi:hypothetical protein